MSTTNSIGCVKLNSTNWLRLTFGYLKWYKRNGHIVHVALFPSLSLRLCVYSRYSIVLLSSYCEPPASERVNTRNRRVAQLAKSKTIARFRSFLLVCRSESPTMHFRMWNMCARLTSTFCHKCIFSGKHTAASSFWYDFTLHSIFRWMEPIWKMLKTET